MRSVRIAERLLCLVAPGDRAASMVGDFLEEAAPHGPRWFWISVTRTMWSFAWRDLTANPFRLAAMAAVAWLVYMIASAILLVAGVLLVPVLWGIPYFLSHHTGVELLTNLLSIRIDWPPPAPQAAQWFESVVILIVTPYLLGRWTSRIVHGQKLVVWIATILLWPLMATFVPFVASYTRVTLGALPVIQAFVLLGLLSKQSAYPTTPEWPSAFRT